MCDLEEYGHLFSRNGTVVMIKQLDECRRKGLCTGITFTTFREFEQYVRQ
jgi:hypothetical protein